MKILVMSQYFYPETFRVNTLCQELVQRGHEVTVLTGYPQYPKGKIFDGFGFDKPYEKEWCGVKIERVKVQPRGRTPLGLILNCYTFVRQGKKWVKKCKQKFDVIYVFEVSPVTVGLPAIMYKKKFGTPILFNVQDLWPENVEIVLGIHNRFIIAGINRIVDKIYFSSDKILCSSEAFVRNIAQRGVPEKKLIFWPQFCRMPSLKKMKKPECYQSKHFNIVFTGNIGEAQGLDLLVEAAERLKDTNVRWFLVGDGRSRERLENRVKEKHLEELVTFVGQVSEDEANEYIYYSDCAYLSFAPNKLFEMTLPAKLQSYMACGTPILAAVGGESANVIMESNSGFVCKQKVDEIERVVRNEVLMSEQLDQLRTNARSYYVANYSIDRVIGEFERILNEVVKENDNE